ncbi:MAG: inorganic phosphate transporter [Desulfobacterales bacterium]|jgi:PiT family inorganic phosphate transporter|nr:inorganic phosphate transporter [Desulfobacterales bacterium]
MEIPILFYAMVVVALALFFGYTNGFHDAANVVATIIATGAMSPRMALGMAALGEFIGPFLFGTAVAQTIEKSIIDIAAFDVRVLELSISLIIAALIGAIGWNLITWFRGLPSSSSHALVGGLVGAVWVAYGPDKIIWRGLLYVILVLFLSPILGFIFGALFLRITFYLSRNATPKATYFFNRMQILSSIALSLSHGANDAQKPMGVIMMSLVVLGFSPSLHIPFWVIISCATVIALGTASGGWRIIKTVGSKIYRLRSVHAFCAQTSSASVILAASLMGGPVSTTHVVSSSIMGVGAEQRMSAVRWGVAKNIMLAWLITIPASAGMAGLSFFIIRLFHPAF